MDGTEAVPRLLVKGIPICTLGRGMRRERKRGKQKKKNKKKNPTLCKDRSTCFQIFRTSVSKHQSVWQLIPLQILTVA